MSKFKPFQKEISDKEKDKAQRSSQAEWEKIVLTRYFFPFIPSIQNRFYSLHCMDCFSRKMINFKQRKI